MKLNNQTYYRFPDTTNNEWIKKYNQLIEDIETKKIEFNKDYLNINRSDYNTNEEYRMARLKSGSGGYHHIIPKKIDPSLEKDKKNLIWLPFKEHMDLHYYLWKANPLYGIHLWFGCIYGRKHKLWDLPGGEDEYNQLKIDVGKYKKLKNELK